jgi:hypothetical protein
MCHVLFHPLGGLSPISTKRINLWKEIQLWALENAQKSTASRTDAFNFIVSKLSTRYQRFSRIGANTAPGLSATGTGAANRQGDQVWFIGVMQADPVS